MQQATHSLRFYNVRSFLSFSYFLIGNSILVARLYSPKPSLRDCLFSAMGMLTAKKSTVLASAPAMRCHAPWAAETTESATPHHIKISPR